MRVRSMRVKSWWWLALVAALVPLAISTPSSAADSEVVVRARGRLGTENVDLLVNGTEVASWELDGSWFKNFEYQVPAGITVGSVEVRNDSGGWPSAVIVDWVEVDGQRYDSSDPATLSSGSWDAATGCAQGYKRSDWLTCDNSWFDYNLSGRYMSVVARGRLGTENVDLLIDGEPVASWDLGTGFETFYHRLPLYEPVGQVRLRNDSGGWPGAVIVDHILVDGIKYDSSSWRTLSSGSWDSADGCGQGVKLSDWLTCDNSWFDYGVDSFPPRYRVVAVNARGRLGGESIDLVIDGSVAQSWDLTTNYDDYYHLYSPPSGNASERGIKSVEIRSEGGGWPNAVIVDHITVEGFEIDTSDGRTLTYGSWESVNGCAEGYKRSDWLTCSDSWIEYDLRSARDPVD